MRATSGIPRASRSLKTVRNDFDGTLLRNNGPVPVHAEPPSVMAKHNGSPARADFQTNPPTRGSACTAQPRAVIRNPFRGSSFCGAVIDCRVGSGHRSSPIGAAGQEALASPGGGQPPGCCPGAPTAPFPAAGSGGASRRSPPRPSPLCCGSPLPPAGHPSR